MSGSSERLPRMWLQNQHPANPVPTTPPGLWLRRVTLRSDHRGGPLRPRDFAGPVWPILHGIFCLPGDLPFDQLGVQQYDRTRDSRLELEMMNRSSLFNTLGACDYRDRLGVLLSCLVSRSLPLPFAYSSQSVQYFRPRFPNTPTTERLQYL